MGRRGVRWQYWPQHCDEALAVGVAGGIGRGNDTVYRCHWPQAAGHDSGQREDMLRSYYASCAAWEDDGDGARIVRVGEK